ncbi:MAG: phosphoenolpyruvate--protein phosphotransferase [Phycisphaerae bacterium]|nr:phosphoenolpyruvate--protein phosphotransferase [Phycisphaerae bacterium]
MLNKTGLAVSPGIAIGKAVILDSEEYQIPKRSISPSLCDSEVQRAHHAFEMAIAELAALEAEYQASDSSEIHDLFSVHRHFLQDQSLRDRVTQRIHQDCVTAEYAASSVLQELHSHFAKVPNRYISERAADVRDIEKRLLRHLIDLKKETLGHLTEEMVVVARELRPTQTAAFDKQFVKGIVCDTGGVTSHASIVARAMGIPAVMALHDLTETVRRGDMLIVDGNSGTVIVNPSAETIARFRETQAAMVALQASFSVLKEQPAMTQDGVDISLMANIEFPRESGAVLDAGAQGIGLFRTEFLYLQSGKEPTEEDHYTAYVQVVKTLNGRPVTIRTMDLGADKFTQSHRFTREDNPFLGLRSIRFSLMHRDMFVAQLRAILRASTQGPVKLMFPLISGVREIQLAREILASVKADLDRTGQGYDTDMPVGIMIEVPSAAVMAACFARYVDFFSIGSNDLTQYALAVDRGNAQVADLFSSFDPGVLRLIQMTVDGAATTGIDVSVCGEMASEPAFVMLLLGMGVRSLSVVPSLIPEVKRIIRSVSMAQCRDLVETVFLMDSVSEIDEYVQQKIRSVSLQKLGDM